MGSDTLVTKGQEYIYSSILELVMALDLSSNNFSGSIPSELMALQALQSLIFIKKSVDRKDTGKNRRHEIT